MSSERAFAFPQLEAPAGGVVRTTDLLSAAWAEAEKIRSDARDAGYEEGRAAGLLEAREEVSALIGALRAALEGVEEMRQELVSALEHDAAVLGLQLAEQVVAGAIAVQPERVIDVARNALRRAADRRRVTLVVNPADLELLADSVKGLQAELGGIEHCDVQADRRVGRGGALLRTEAGEIDVAIGTQLEHAREIVMDALSSGRS
jgi:flagellar assembly protein FliH